MEGKQMGKGDATIVSAKREIPVRIIKRVRRNTYIVEYGDGHKGFFENGTFTNVQGTTIFKKAIIYKSIEQILEEL